MNKSRNGNTEIQAHEKRKGRGATWHPVDDTTPERQQQNRRVWLRGRGNRQEASIKEVVTEMQDWATPGLSLNTTVLKAHSKR